jgi:hypothetical protein
LQLPIGSSQRARKLISLLKYPGLYLIAYCRYNQINL